MYKFIKAKPEHAKQLIPYLTKTCYWKEFIDGNTWCKDQDEFAIEWIINPRLPYTTILVKEGDEHHVYGCMIALTSEQLAALPDFSSYIAPRALEVFSPWLGFPVADSLVLELVFVAPELQGQGYGSKFGQLVEDLAKKENKECISAFIWSFFPDSLITATRKGAAVKACIYFEELIELPLLYIEKRALYAKLKDYFQSEEYWSVPNMLDHKTK